MPKHIYGTKSEIQSNLLKEIHGTLDTVVQLPSPHDPTRHRSHVPANGGVQFLLHVDVGNHFNVPVIIVQNVLILGISSKVRDTKSVFIE